MLQLAIIQTSQQPGCSAIVQMAESPRYSLFQHRRIRAVAQHIRIVIALKYHRITTAQDIFNMRCGVSRVSQYPKAPATIPKSILHWFAGVMGNRERLHLDLADLKCCMTIDQACIDQRLSMRVILEGAVRQPDGNVILARKLDRTAYMIGMLVGDENAAEVFRSQFEPGKPGNRLPDAETAVEEQARLPDLDHKRIATAATA